MYSANALYFLLVIKARIKADALSSLDTMPTPCTKRRRVFTAAMTPLRSTWGARVTDGVVARAALGDEAAAARAMRSLMEGGRAERATLSTIDKILVNPVTIRVFVGDIPMELMRSVASSICVISMSSPLVVSKSPLKKTETSFR
jgi:hypothetical protein